MLNFAYRAPFQWDSPKNAQFEVSVRVMRNAFDDNDLFGANLSDAKDFKRSFKTCQRKKKKGFESPKKAEKQYKFRNYQHKYKKFKCDFDKNCFDF